MMWEKIKLGDLYDIHNGLSKERQYFGTGYPFLSFSTIFNHFFIPDEIPDLVQSSENEQKNYSILRGDVFITRTSETFDELGMSCVALKDYPTATYNGFAKRMRPKTNKILPEYIGYYLRTTKFRNQFRAFSTMTTRASLRNSDLLSLTVPVPPMHIQHRIADILSAYDDLIEVNQKQIHLLEEAARRLYKEWFVDLHFPGHENALITDGIPEGWKKASLNEIAQFSRGKTITQKQTISGNIPVIAGGLEPAYYHNTSNTEAPVITVSASGANAGFTQIHYQKIWASDCSFTDDTTTSHLYFVYCFLKQNHNLMSNLQKGSAQPHVYAKDINKLPLLLPPQTLICKFEEAVTSFFHTSENCLAKIKLAAEARNRLLPKLMSGEIEV